MKFNKLLISLMLAGAVVIASGTAAKGAEGAEGIVGAHRDAPLQAGGNANLTAQGVTRFLCS